MCDNTVKIQNIKMVILLLGKRIILNADKSYCIIGNWTEEKVFRERERGGGEEEN
jgi:hypothetical protein